MILCITEMVEFFFLCLAYCTLPITLWIHVHCHKGQNLLHFQDREYQSNKSGLLQDQPSVKVYGCWVLVPVLTKLTTVLYQVYLRWFSYSLSVSFFWRVILSCGFYLFCHLLKTVNNVWEYNPTHQQFLPEHFKEGNAYIKEITF